MENHRIFIGNLPFSLCEESFFHQYSSVEINKIDILQLEDGRPSGFAIIYVNSDVKIAIKEIDGTEFGGRLISATEYIAY